MWENQFVCVKGSSTIATTFSSRQLVEKYGKNNRNLCVFIDLENVYNKVHREILNLALIKIELPNMYVNIIEEIYQGTSV